MAFSSCLLFPINKSFSVIWKERPYAVSHGAAGAFPIMSPSAEAAEMIVTVVENQKYFLCRPLLFRTCLQEHQMHVLSLQQLCVCHFYVLYFFLHSLFSL